MRVSLTYLLFIVVFYTTFLEETGGVRRRNRCYVRLCYKCGMYINSRGKRSTLDGENELDSPEDDVGDGLERYYMSKIKNRRWTDRNSRQMDAMLRSELPDEFDTIEKGVTPQFDSAVSDTTKGKGRHRKRSVTAHVERCIHVLKSRCCQTYTNVVTYIGLRLKN